MPLDASQLSDRQRRLLLALCERSGGTVARELAPGERGPCGETIYGLTKRFNAGTHALDSSAGWGTTMKSLVSRGLVVPDKRFRGSGSSVEAWLLTEEGLRLATTELDPDWVCAQTPIAPGRRRRLSPLAARAPFRAVDRRRHGAILRLCPLP